MALTGWKAGEREAERLAYRNRLRFFLSHRLGATSTHSASSVCASYVILFSPNSELDQHALALTASGHRQKSAIDPKRGVPGPTLPAVAEACRLQSLCTLTAPPAYAYADRVANPRQPNPCKEYRT